MRTFYIENREEIDAIIRSCKTCFLGLSDSANQPYVIPMNFSLDGDYIYLHSGQIGRKLLIMKENPKACVTFCDGDDLAYQDEEIACSWRVKSKSVIAEGIIEFIDDYDEKLRALHVFMKQYSDRAFNFSEPAVRNVVIFRMKIEKIAAKHFGAKAITPWNS
jgi:uncharacterized protein